MSVGSLRARIGIPGIDRNGRYILAARVVRAFGFGLSSVALGLYVGELGIPAATAGVIFAAALVGTMLLTLVIALRGDRIGRRRLLVAGSLLMVLALLIPLAGDVPIVLILIGLTGMIAVTANESTGLHSVDQAILPQTVAPRDRTAVFALYGVLAFVSTAVGSISVGPLVLLGERLGLSGPDRYATTFGIYAFAGLLAALFASRLDRSAEVGKRIEQRFAITRSRSVVARLSALFALDAFAGGLIVQSFLAYVLAARFGFTPGELGILFFGASLLGAGSFPIAVRLARRFGLIETMVFTHIPASLLLMAVAVTPTSLPGVAAVLYLLRALLASMDVPVRQSYLMSVVDASERTATAGVTSLARSASQSLAPLVGGVVLVPLGLAAPLIACGVLKIGYDLLLLAAFRARRPPDDVA